MKSLIVRSMLLAAMAQTAWAAPPAPVIDVYKSPTCGCCGKWIDHLKASGFTVRALDTADVAQHKRRLGIPPEYASCHTAELAGYAIEGHVPARDIKRLLQEKPQARGLAVPGMPIGSPGMEQGARREPYAVLLVDPNGSARTFSRY